MCLFLYGVGPPSMASVVFVITSIAFLMWFYHIVFLSNETYYLFCGSSQLIVSIPRILQFVDVGENVMVL